MEYWIWRKSKSPTHAIVANGEKPFRQSSPTFEPKANRLVSFSQLILRTIIDCRRQFLPRLLKRPLASKLLISLAQNPQEVTKLGPRLTAVARIKEASVVIDVQSGARRSASHVDSTRSPILFHCGVLE